MENPDKLTTMDVTKDDDDSTYTAVIKSTTIPYIEVPEFKRKITDITPKIYGTLIKTTVPLVVNIIKRDSLTTMTMSKDDTVTPPLYTFIIKSPTSPSIKVPASDKPATTTQSDKLLEQITTQITNETQKIVSKLADIQDIISKSPGEKVDTSMIDKIQTIVTKSMGNIDASLNNIEILNKTIMNLITNNVSEQRMIGGMNILLGIGILIIFMKKNI